MKKLLELLAHICLIAILSTIAFGGATKTRAECRSTPCGGFTCTPYSRSGGGCGTDYCITCEKCCRTQEGACQQFACTRRTCDSMYCENRLGW